MGRTTRSAVRKGKDQLTVDQPSSSVGLATSTPAKDTKRKRPVMPSPGLSPLKSLQRANESMVILKPAATSPAKCSPAAAIIAAPEASSTSTSSCSVSEESILSEDISLEDYMSAMRDRAGDATECTPARKEYPAKRRRRKREKSITAAVEKLQEEVKGHFQEIEEFSLEFV